MRRVVLGLTTAALFVLPATAVPAYAGPDIPEVNCGIAACPWDETVRNLDQCVEGAKTAIRYIIQGTPQPQECNLP